MANSADPVQMAVFFLRIPSGMANSADPDQTVPECM